VSFFSRRTAAQTNPVVRLFILKQIDKRFFSDNLSEKLPASSGINRNGNWLALLQWKEES
jgi:hypothetical protein